MRLNQKIVATSIAVSLGLLGPVPCPATVYAEWVWDPTIGKLMRADAELKATDQEQMTYIDELITKKEFDGAIAACEKFKSFFPQSRLMPDVLFKEAGILETLKEHFKAFRMYQRVLDEYPNNNYLNRILYRQFEIGVMFMEGERYRVMGVPTVPRLSKAVEIFEKIKATCPFHEYGEKAQYYLGLTLEKKGDYEEALQAFEALLDEYPNTKFAADASFRMGEVMYKMSQQSSENAERADSAKKQFDDFVAKYPDEQAIVAKARQLKQQLTDREAKQLYKIAYYYEQQRHLESALVYYKEVIDRGSGTVWAEKSAKRVAVLEKPEETLRSEDKQLKDDLSAVIAEMEALRQQQATLKKNEYKAQLEEKKQRRHEIEKQIKDYNDRKKDEIDLRWDAVDRKQREIKVSRKNLALKRKTIAGKVDDEFLQAFDRWEKAIDEEEEHLAQERETLAQMSAEFGYKRGRWMLWEFGISGRDVEKVRSFRSDDVNSLAEKRQRLDAQLQEFVTKYQLMLTTPAVKPAPAVPAPVVEQPTETQSEAQAVVAGEKMRQHREKLGADIEKAKQAIADIDRLMAVVPADAAKAEAEKALPQSEREARRAIKSLEKEINRNYRVISDAEKATYGLNTELNASVKKTMNERRPLLVKPVYALSAPLRFLGRGFKAFIFGLPTEEKTQQKAETLAQNDSGSDSSERLADINRRIQLENSKIAVAQKSNEALYAEREKLQGMVNKESFTSIIAKPFRLLSFKESEKKTDDEFLKNYRAEQEAILARCESELAAMTAETSAPATPEAPAVEGPQPPVAPAEPAVTAVSPVQSKKNRKLLAHQREEILDVLNDYRDVLDACGEIEHDRTARIETVLKKAGTVKNELTQQLTDLRKESYRRLDEIVMKRQELAQCESSLASEE